MTAGNAMKSGTAKTIVVAMPVQKLAAPEIKKAATAMISGISERHSPHDFAIISTDRTGSSFAPTVNSSRDAYEYLKNHDKRINASGKPNGAVLNDAVMASDIAAMVSSGATRTGSNKPLSTEPAFI